MKIDTKDLRFDAHGLVPAIVQDVESGQVLMLAYMNEESLQKTLESGQTWFWSRSRKQLWHKGETSGNVQDVKEITYDCDADTLLIKVVQTGVACHTGERSCFYNHLYREGEKPAASYDIINQVYDVVMSRKAEMPEGSYTTYLFEKGIDKICKKVGEESAEVIIGAKNRSKDEVIYEVSDLLYHLMVLLAEQGVTPKEVYAELAKRR